MKNVIHIVGARPNFIKAAPVIKKMISLNPFDINNMILHTGQHYDHNMSQQFFDDLEIPTPDFNLGAGGGTHATQTANIMIGCERVFVEHSPTMIIVYGDVNSCVASTLVASKLHLEEFKGKRKIIVAHVESGLRSFDNMMPEEINRIITDKLADCLFLTSEDALDNLKNDGVDLTKCHVVGNTMIDSLVQFEDKFDTSNILSECNLITGGYGLITLHRPSNVDDKKSLQGMMDSIVEVSKEVKCVFPIHPRTKKSLMQYKLYNNYNSIDSIHIMDPLGYIDFMCLQKNAKFIVTDSGGIQEESSHFNVPCLTVRDNTERPVTVTHGTNKLIGTDYGNIVNEVKSIDYKTTSNIKLWDGNSAERIVRVLGKILDD